MENRSQSFNDALQAINNALKTESASLKELLTADYANLRAAIEDAAPRMSEQAVASGKTLAHQLTSEIDRQIRENPYLVLGGVAAGALALGYFFGRKQTPSSDYSGLSYGVSPDPVEMSSDGELG